MAVGVLSQPHLVSTGGVLTLDGNGSGVWRHGNGGPTYVILLMGTVTDVVQSVTVTVEVTVSWVQLLVVSHRLLKNGNQFAFEIEADAVAPSILWVFSRCFKPRLRL